MISCARKICTENPCAQFNAVLVRAARFSAMSIVLGVVAGTTAACAQDDLARFDAPDAWQEDASLCDVFFLDPNTGWAVGGQGTVLQTANGGASWRAISTAPQDRMNDLTLMEKFRNPTMTTESDVSRPVRCHFESVFFADPSNGWIAGGYSVPYVARSRAFVLKTTDGGKTWNVVQGLVLPKIAQVHFDDARRGWAVGDRSSLSPSGVFYSSDGGGTWSSESSDSEHDWIRAARTPSGFVTIDRRGQLFVVNESGVNESLVQDDDRGHRVRMTDVEMIDGQRGWSVGSGGAVRATSNGGRTWNTPTNLQLEANHAGTNHEQVQANIDLVRQFDFNAITLTSSKLWIAADPGSILSIDRATGAILRHSTGVLTPLNEIEFVDEQNGWAVGASGVILATNNGGESWHSQRSGNRETALLSIAVQGSDTSQNSAPAWQAFARFAAEENHLTATLLLHDDPKPDADSQPGLLLANAIKETRSTGRIGGVAETSLADVAALRQATARLGCSFLVDDCFDSLETVDPLLLTERLVRRIRSVRPRVVLTGRDPQLNSVIRNAISAAADPSRFVAQIDVGGLEAWQVDRFAREDPAGAETVDLKQLLPRSGCLVEDRIAISRALAGHPARQLETARYSVEDISHAAIGSGNRSGGGLLAGLDHAGHPLPVRKQSTGVRGTMAMVRHLSQKQNFVTVISGAPDPSPDIRRNNVQTMAGPLDYSDAGMWVLELAAAHAERGDFDFAAETVELFAVRYAEHALAPSALLWLTEYYASEEVAAAMFAKTKSSITDRATSASRAVVAAVPRRRNVGGVTQISYEVDESILPVEAARHYSYDEQRMEVVPEVDSPGIFDRLLRRDRSHPESEQAGEQPENPQPGDDSRTTEQGGRSENEPASEDRRTSSETGPSGLSATAVPDFATNDDSKATQTNRPPAIGAVQPASAELPVAEPSFVDPAEIAARNKAAENDAARNTVLYQQYFRARLARASQWLSMLKQRDPDLGQSAEVEFLESKLARQLGGGLSSQQICGKLARSRSTPESVEIAARRELAGDRQNQNPAGSLAPPVVAQRTNQRPVLDGNPDDAFWQTAIERGAVMTRHTGSNDQPDDLIVFAHDAGFLYLFVRCSNLNSAGEGSDRFVLRIDSDRDYKTTADFSVEASGQTTDGWSGWAGVEQDWYVATARDDVSWSAEFAIPLDKIIAPTIDSAGNPIHTNAQRTSGEQLWAIEIARQNASGIDVWSENEPALNGKNDGKTWPLSTIESRAAEFEMLSIGRD